MKPNWKKLTNKFYKPDMEPGINQAYVKKPGKNPGFSLIFFCIKPFFPDKP